MFKINLVPFIFLTLSVIGSYLLNNYNINILIIILYSLIIFFNFIISKFKIKGINYPLIIIFTGLALNSILALRSNYIIGSDAHTEYYIFYNTLISGRWSILVNSPLDGCLSISIFPSIFGLVLNCDPEFMFKTLYSVIFSLQPLLIYFISKHFLKPYYAYLASLFYISQEFFLWSAYNPRTSLSIYFYTFFIFILLTRYNKNDKKLFFSLVFILSVVFSHYSTTYIFLITYILYFIMGRIINRYIFNPISSNFNNIYQLLFLSILIYIWYSQITKYAFISGISFFTTSILSLHDFFIMESRGPSSAILGYNLASKTVPQIITFLILWLTIICICIGVLSFTYIYIIKKRYLLNYKYNLYLNLNILALVSSLILVISVLLPNLLKGYDMSRIYAQNIVILSIFFIIGSEKVSNYISKKNKNIIILTILISFFICSTGLIYQFFGNPYSITLNHEGEQYKKLYIHDSEATAIKWLTNNNNNSALIYSDFYGVDRIVSQGHISPALVKYDIDYIENNLTPKDLFYVRYTAVRYNLFLDRDNVWINIDPIKKELLYSKNLIYSNNGSLIVR